MEGASKGDLMINDGDEVIKSKNDKSMDQKHAYVDLSCSTTAGSWTLKPQKNEIVGQFIIFKLKINFSGPKSWRKSVRKFNFHFSTITIYHTSSYIQYLLLATPLLVLLLSPLPCRFMTKTPIVFSSLP